MWKNAFGGELKAIERNGKLQDWAEGEERECDLEGISDGINVIVD